MKLDEIVEVQVLYSADLANHFLARGYRLLSIQPHTHEKKLKANPAQTFVKRGADFVVGRTADVMTVDFPEPVTKDPVLIGTREKPDPVKEVSGGDPRP